MKKLIALTLALSMMLIGSAFAEEFLIGTQETGTAGYTADNNIFHNIFLRNG